MSAARPDTPPDTSETTRRAVLRRFEAVAPGADTAPFAAPEHAAVAFVWMVDDGFVLRARADGPDAADDFADELALAERVRPLLPYALPDPLETDDGARFVRAGGLLWTLHPALPGRVRCPWQELENADDGTRRALVRELRALHDRTRGRLGAGDPGRVVREGRANAARFADRLPERTRDRLTRAFVRVMYNAAHFELDDLAFVHGDFHWGNLLTGDDGAPSGLVDLDWSRVAHPLEDLGYTAMMLVRRTDGAPHRLADLDRIWSWYGADESLRILYPDYVLLYALYDVALFEDAPNLPDRDRYLRAQWSLVEALAA